MLYARDLLHQHFGYIYMAHAALRHMRAGASIVNTGSITGLEGNKELLDYAATKGAIHAFTKSLAQQLVERKIRVNCVAPGPIWTPLNVADKEPEEAGEHGKDTPMKRPGQPEEVAPAYVSSRRTWTAATSRERSSRCSVVNSVRVEQRSIASRTLVFPTHAADRKHLGPQFAQGTTCRGPHGPKRMAPIPERWEALDRVEAQHFQEER